MIPIAADWATHVTDLIAKPCTEWDIAIARTLLALIHHIELRAEIVNSVVHLHPLRPVTVAEEVLVLRRFLEFTDSPVHWHAPAEAAASDLIWVRA